MTKARQVLMNKQTVIVLLAGMSLATLIGCGQKGDLYSPQQAPSNTKFILYGNNSDEGRTDSKTIDSKTTDSNAVPDVGVNDEQMSQILSDPNDY